MARKRKPGRPKGSKNKKRSKSASTRRKAGRRKSKATPAQLRALKKAWAARRKSGKKTKKKAGKRKATAKQLANLKLARAARELKNMPKTLRHPGSQRGMMTGGNWAADTVRAPHPNSMPSILMRVRRRPTPTLISKYN